MEENLEAKDIVAKEVHRQAQFGYEPSWQDFVIVGQEAGMEEVVEWIKEYYPPDKVQIDWKSMQSDNKWAYYLQIPPEDFEAKLKEWGIK